MAKKKLISWKGIGLVIFSVWILVFLMMMLDIDLLQNINHSRKRTSVQRLQPPILEISKNSIGHPKQEIREMSSAVINDKNMDNSWIYPKTNHSHCQSWITQQLEVKKQEDCKVVKRHRQDVSLCTSFSCHSIISGDNQMALKHATDAFNFPYDIEIQYLAFNCSTLFQTGNYITEISEEERDFPLAYSILVFKDAGQVEMLLQTIYRPNNVYCLHVDEKSSDVFKKAMSAFADCFDNVFLSSKSVNVIYAGFSRLYADILCMKDLSQTKYSWKYVINIAGQAMPLKTNWEMVQILKLYNGANDIEGVNNTIQDRFKFKWVVANSSDRQNLHGDHKMQKTNELKSPPPHNIQIVRGSAYGSFSRAFIEYVLTNQIPQDLLRWSMDTYSPDEHFWATLNHLHHNPHLKTPGGYKGPPWSKPWLSSHSVWSGQGLCYGKHTVNTSPCVFSVKDVPLLVNRRELFANKFFADYQPIGQMCLGMWVQSRSRCQTPLDISFYKNIPFVKDHNLIEV